MSQEKSQEIFCLIKHEIEGGMREGERERARDGETERVREEKSERWRDREGERGRDGGSKR